MSIRLGLKARFLLASLGLAAVLIGGFTLAVQKFLEVLERGLSVPEFRAEFAQYSRTWAANPAELPPLKAGYEAYVMRPGVAHTMPRKITTLAAGIHAEMMVDDLEYAVGRFDGEHGSLFLLRDARYDPVERLEAQINEIAFYALLTAALLATGMALWLVNLVLRPVEALARHAAQVVPDSPRLRFEFGGEDPAIGLIARAFDAALERYDDLVERERAFARDASHELRTPLTVILTGVELLEPSLASDPLAAARLNRLRAAAEQMAALTEGLLFLARPDAPPPTASFAAGDALSEAVRMQGLAFGPGFDAELIVDKDCELAVPRGLFLCVVNNLLRNAIEHGGAGRIHVTLDGHDLMIADSGPGLTADACATMFEQHRRGPRSSGHGLGLFIVQRICRRLGWGLTVDSAPGAGTRVTVRLDDDRPP